MSARRRDVATFSPSTATASRVTSATQQTRRNPAVAVIERNLRVGQRIARVLATATGMPPTTCADTRRALAHEIGHDTRLIACGGEDLEAALEWIETVAPSAHLVVWTDNPTALPLMAAAQSPRLSDIIGWPRFLSMPRPWELALVARRALRPLDPGPRLDELLRWGAWQRSWVPLTTQDLEAITADAKESVLRLGGSDRTAERIARVAHELLMNAMYDAPADTDGAPLYAHDRAHDIALAPEQAPRLRLASDGVAIALESWDPFGRLRRPQVFESLLRGVRGGQGADQLDEIVDQSGGGAGLGLYHLYRDSAVLMFDVIPGRCTTVTSLHELDVNPREQRSMPSSLHYFESTK